MYTVILKENFRASHYVRMPDGSIEKPHNHDWKLEVAVSTEELDNNGFAVEFLSLQDTIRNVLKKLDSRDLNQIDDFKPNFPTTEIVSKYVYDNIKKHLPFGVVLEYTLLEESKGCYIRYTEQ
ncbi:MAG: 6-pyruvoyl trahydropterin synthase family protein [Sedimentisphaeraceae bacterium JB056]